jgi:hypothetical protein
MARPTGVRAPTPATGTAVTAPEESCPDWGTAPTFHRGGMILVYSFRRILRMKAIALQSEETLREIFSAGCPEMLHPIRIPEFLQDKKLLSETVTVPVDTKINPV